MDGDNSAAQNGDGPSHFRDAARSLPRLGDRINSPAIVRGAELRDQHRFDGSMIVYHFKTKPPTPK